MQAGSVRLISLIFSLLLSLLSSVKSFKNTRFEIELFVATSLKVPFNKLLSLNIK